MPKFAIMKKVLKGMLLGSALLTMSPVLSFGQGCVVCTRTAEQQGEDFAKGMNRGILYLAFLPLGIMGTLGFIYWKYRH